MHRLASARNLYLNSCNNVSFPSRYSNTSLLEIKCSICQKHLLGRPHQDKIFVTRHQSTRTASVLKALNKKSKRKTYKKYSELLEVGEQAMTETKVSISKLGAAQLSKLTTSSVSLGQLHQLTKKCTKNSKLTEVDTDLLKSVKEKILKKVTGIGTVTNVTRFSSTQPGNKSPSEHEVVLQDDQCALVYTNKPDNTDSWLNKHYIESLKKSYYNFQKTTLYDDRLQDLRCAINEGLNQSDPVNLDLDANALQNNLDVLSQRKGPHAVFRELFVENQIDNFDEEMIGHMSNLQTMGLAHPVIEDIMEDTGLQHEIDPSRDDEELDNNLLDLQNIAKVKSLKIKKVKAMKEKKKELREKRRAIAESSMKQKLDDMEQRGKQEALQTLLTAHLQLLCSLGMIHEGRQVLRYYRCRSSRLPYSSQIKDVKVYNALLHGYATSGNYENAKELLSYMEADNIDPTPQTYAATFECIERSKLHDKVALLQNTHNKMNEKGITLNDLLDKSKFLYDQREVVLRAIRHIEPHFEPQYTPPVLDYDCPLLDDLKLNMKHNRMGFNISQGKGVVTIEELKKNAKIQLENEIRGDIEIENIAVKSKETDSSTFYSEKLKETKAEWLQVIKEAFIRNLSTLKSQSNASHAAITLYPYLKVFEVDQFVDLIMDELSKLVDGSETYSPTLKLLQRELGTLVYHKYQIEQYRRNGVLDKISKVYDRYCEWYINRNTEEPLNCRQAWQMILHKDMEGASLDIEETPWPMEMRQNIGKFLYNIIINDVKIDINMFKPKAKVKKLPAVYKVHRPWGRMVRLELKPHPALARLWAAAAPALRMRAALVASLVPPQPWTSPDHGAYLLTDVPLIRMPMHISGQWQQIRSAAPNKLYPVLDSLNQLAEVPWRINQPVLDLQLQVFRSGGDKKLDIAPPSSSLDVSQFGEDSDPAAVFKRRVAINRARAEMHSLWCDALYKLSLANHYRDKTFWLPHNMDFRGRVYACPPHISQLGADAARALLLFAAARPLGPRGLHWLKLHAINLTGAMKKNTVNERLAYADSILDKILDSADRPLTGERWWTKSEEPWQTLAACMEIANAVRSNNHEEYLCGFPVHQDGSCNGLQHYAALGGDRDGAAAVNLAPRPEPSDLYQLVAYKVEEMRKTDAAAGLPAAIVLENFVRRKVIKQTVMTTVYGVTRFGARLQIAKQLKDIDEFPKDQVWACSHYLTSKTFESLRQMFSSTKLIQDWFTDCAKAISVVCGESVQWETPLGLPVVQPYYRRHAAHAHHALDSRARPCTMKQRNAFPPNFIHSLDSSHMMLTGLRCQARGLTFVSVHDCFWTHPHTVAEMNEICREQFVALHSQPILEDLSEYFIKKYSYSDSELQDSDVGAANKKRVNELLKKVPKKGNFDISGVLKSVYFFS